MNLKSSTAPDVRLAIISPNPVPYKSPVWRHLHEAMGIDLKVFYPVLDGAAVYHDPLFGRDVTWDIPLLEGYPWSQVRNRSYAWLNWRFRYCVPDIGRHLAEGGFTHLLLVGKEYFYYHQALKAARRLGMKILYRAESHPPPSALVREWAARISRWRWYHQIDRFLCVGRYQYAEYEQYGVPRDRMLFSPYCVDNNRFAADQARWMPEREAIRREFGFSSDTCVVGYSGKIYPRKNPLELIRAMARLNPAAQKFGLLMVGDGIMKAECERQARSLLKGPVAFTGFLNQTQLARGYTAMDIFIMPSLWETWGLVLNEAMACGLPAVATTTVKAACDLIEPGVNGYCYKSGDEPALAENIETIARKVKQGASMGEASRRRVADYSVECACLGIVEALNCCR